MEMFLEIRCGGECWWEGVRVEGNKGEEKMGRL